MLNYYELADHQGTCELDKVPEDLSGFQFCLSGGTGRFCVAWKDESGQVRVIGKEGELQHQYKEAALIAKAVDFLPAGIVLWFGIFEDDGVLLMDVLTTEEATLCEESPTYRERLSRATEIMEALEDEGIDIVANKCYGEPKGLMANADLWGLSVIAVKDVPYSQRGWCFIYHGKKESTQ